MLTRLYQPAIRHLATTTNPITIQCLLTIRPRARLSRIPHSKRLFTTTPPRSDNTAVNHYEVLKLPPECTKAELKKQFYILSKETHPDINRNDPDAPRRFSQISESYSVLADPEKRRRYDRDFARTHASSSPSTRQRGASYAGSRPASGLSKRRGAFRGPPPSFYKHGNPSASSASSSSSSTTSGNAGGPFNASAFSDATFDFDSTSTFKTQTHEDSRRQTRRAAEMAAAAAQAEDEGDFWVRFAVVTGVVVLGVTVATMVASMGPPKGGFLRGDGSRRNEKRNDWTNGS